MTPMPRFWPVPSLTLGRQRINRRRQARYSAAVLQSLEPEVGIRFHALPQFDETPVFVAEITCCTPKQPCVQFHVFGVLKNAALLLPLNVRNLHGLRGMITCLQ
jgi:hypothetical protein